MIRMATSPAAASLADVFDGGSLSGLTEGQLLERFLDRRDERAFELIVSRHAAMVLGVCRRVLRDPHDVDDAFQATFLILVRNASTIRAKDRLSPWLYGVAFKVATRARSVASARRRREGPNGLDAVAETPRPDPSTDLATLIDEELSRLPEKYRAPVVLCGLEGQTHDEAAAQLGWPVGTVRSRLFRARERLRDRLKRRGVSPLVALPERLTEILPANPPATATLIETTARFGNAGALKTAASATVTALTRGVLTSMFMTKLKVAAGLVLVATTFGSGAVLLAQQPGSKKVPVPVAQDTGGTQSPVTKTDRALTSSDPEAVRPTPSGELLARLELARAKNLLTESLRNRGGVSNAELNLAMLEVRLTEAQVNDAVGATEDALELLGVRKERLEAELNRLRKAHAQKLNLLTKTQELAANAQASQGSVRLAEAAAEDLEWQIAMKSFDQKEVSLRMSHLIRDLRRLKPSKYPPVQEPR